MDQLVNIILAIDKVYTTTQSAHAYVGETRFVGPSIPLPLLRGSVAFITTSLPDVPLGISLISY